MSNWDMHEVRSLDERHGGGNAVACARWLANAPDVRPRPGELAKYKRFIEKAYIDECFSRREEEGKLPATEEPTQAVAENSGHRRHRRRKHGSRAQSNASEQEALDFHGGNTTSEFLFAGNGDGGPAFAETCFSNPPDPGGFWLPNGGFEQGPAQAWAYTSPPSMEEPRLGYGGGRPPRPVQSVFSTVAGRPNPVAGAFVPASAGGAPCRVVPVNDTNPWARQFLTQPVSAKHSESGWDGVQSNAAAVGTTVGSTVESSAGNSSPRSPWCGMPVLHPTNPWAEILLQPGATAC